MEKLNNVCELITCGVAKRPEYYSEGIPFLSSKNVKENRFILDHYNFISQEDYIQLTKYNKPEIGDVLYTRVGSFGEAAVVNFDFDFAIFVSLTLIKPKKDILDSKYLMYYLNSPKMRDLANKSTSGIGVQNLNVNAVRKFPIPLPPLPTQKAIATKLDKAQEIISYNKQLIEKYDQLIQSIFIDMFGDIKSNSKNWDLKPLDYFVKFDTKMTSDFVRYADKPHIGIANIEKQTGKLIDYKLISEENLSSGKYIFDESHIIYSKIRPNLNKVALPHFSGLCSADSYPLKIIKENANRIFFAYVLRSDSFIDFILSHSTRTNIPKANKEQMKKYIGIAPPVSLQNQFADRIEKIETQKQMAQESLAKSEALFQSLLQESFK